MFETSSELPSVHSSKASFERKKGRSIEKDRRQKERNMQTVKGSERYRKGKNT
jgi:hypothetical protein